MQQKGAKNRGRKHKLLGSILNARDFSISHRQRGAEDLPLVREKEKQFS